MYRDEYERKVPDNAIKVIGIGGAGCAVADKILAAGVCKMQLIAIDRDIKILRKSHATVKIFLPLFSQSDDTEEEKRAYSQISDALIGADLLFITASLGGRTATKYASEIAKIAKKKGIPTIALVITPSIYEFPNIRKASQDALHELSEYADVYVDVSFDRIFMAKGLVPPDEAFELSDSVICQAVKMFSDIIYVPGKCSVDLADIMRILGHKGRAYFGIGTASGEGAAVAAAEEAIGNSFVKGDFCKAKSVIVNIALGEGKTIDDCKTVMVTLYEKLNPDVDIVFSTDYDPEYADNISVTVFATGFDED